jgi:hypothetical protein
MFTTIILLSQMYICLTSGKSLISEVDNPLQEAAFSVTTDRPIGPVRWWRITDEPTTITWRWWRITKIITLRPIISTVQPTEPAPITTVTEPAPIMKVTSFTPSYAQISVISNKSTTVTTTIVTDKQLETSTKSKSEIHREKLERDLELFRGFGILQQILAAFIG